MEKKTITISLRRFILIVVAAVVLFVGGIGFVLYRAGFALQWSQKYQRLRNLEKIVEKNYYTDDVSQEDLMDGVLLYQWIKRSLFPIHDGGGICLPTGNRIR